MKKILLFLTATALLFSFAACKGEEPTPAPTDASVVSSTEGAPSGSDSDTNVTDTSGSGTKTNSAAVSDSDIDTETDSEHKTDSSSKNEEEPPKQELSVEDVLGTWSSESGDFIHIATNDTGAILLTFGNWNDATALQEGIATDLIELEKNRWNVLISFDGGVSALGYTLTLSEEGAASFGKSGQTPQIFRFDPNRQRGE